MNRNNKLTVREIKQADIKPLVDYWLNAAPDFLVGMGVDLAKLPSREAFTQMLENQIVTPLEHKQSYALIWEVNGKQVGHSNINQIEFGKQATMHLHLWNGTNRRKGIGSALLKLSLPLYFKHFNLQQLICEPYALNPAPNKTLAQVGFTFEKSYVTTPGSINFEQQVNRWMMSKEVFESTYGAV